MNRYVIYGLLAAALLPGAISMAVAADQDQLQTRDQLQTQDKDQLRTPDQDRDQLRTQTRDRDQIYGSQLMTPAERTQYRNHMRNLRTVQERERYRLEHHRQMQERARERGVTIPDEPPVRGGNMGPGGGGMGPGGGMGSQPGRP